jgi:hypothetical protein
LQTHPAGDASRPPFLFFGFNQARQPALDACRKNPEIFIDSLPVHD